MRVTRGRVYHVTDAITGGSAYMDSDGVDRWDYTAACAIAALHYRLHPGEFWAVKEVADPRVQWRHRQRS